MVDLCILLDHVKCVIGVQSKVISCGVTQVSVLGPFILALYVLPLGSVFGKYNIFAIATLMTFSYISP